jgi:hypothetical protein
MGETLHLLVLEEALRLGEKSGGYARESLPIYRGRYMDSGFERSSDSQTAGRIGSRLNREE